MISAAGKSEGKKGGWLPTWVVLSFLAALLFNVLASVSTGFTIGLMAHVSEFAQESRAVEEAVLPYFRIFAYGIPLFFLGWYSWPLLGFARCEEGTLADDVVRRRAVSMPAVIALTSLAMWLVSVIGFPITTLIYFGRWSTELMSQQVLSPLVNGFMAATMTYLAVDWIFRMSVYPQLFPDGGLTRVRGALTLGVRARMLVFLSAVAFLPMFTMLGIARSAQVRFQAGLDPASVVDGLANGSTIIFAVYTSIGIFLTLIFARTFTLPLAEVLGVVRRVSGGDLHGGIRVGSADEVGTLQEGVNSMVAGLRDKERVMQAFGRAVEPAVRDRLLSDSGTRAEAVTGTVLFCDLRGFTALTEQSRPEEVVETLNAFFTEVAQWTRECGGMVDKYIGDAALCVFSVLSDDDADDGAAGAARFALGLRSRLDALNASRRSEGKPELAVRMAMHTGELLVGTIGSRDRHEFTVIGDCVNVAARLNELCKERAAWLIVSQRSYDSARAAGIEVEAGATASVSVRGRSEPVSFVEVV